MKNFINAYNNYNFARFYDWAYRGYDKDIPFYLSLAKEYGSPILELACGTCRLTLPLARKGYSVTGIDVSVEMLKIAREKIEKESPEVRDRIHLSKGNMAHFKLDQKFHMIFIPLASLFHLHSREDKLRCFRCAREHLSDDGIFVIDVRPAEKMKNQEVGRTVEIQRGVNPATRLMTIELNKKLSIDEQLQRVEVEHTYIEELGENKESRFVFIQNYTWVTEDEMRRLLGKAGFDGIKVAGGYDFHEFDGESERMIFLVHQVDNK